MSNPFGVASKLLRRYQTALRLNYILRTGNVVQGAGRGRGAALRRLSGNAGAEPTGTSRAERGVSIPWTHFYVVGYRRE